MFKKSAMFVEALPLKKKCPLLFDIAHKKKLNILISKISADFKYF